MLQYLIDLGAGSARAEVFVGQDIAELPYVGTEFADGGVVSCGGLGQLCEVVRDRLNVFFALGSVVGAQAQRLGQLV
ncbi:hypothetical protein QRB41_26875 [Mycobacterium avium subsp. hominissuis]|uniref:hypothetical protein n=1 Tax=Mycobacterium avium TaxID=1764 RepID=UPI0026666AE1|nr:hypothetical protein [Mycobacterium avium]MDO2386941.1 hypothetical protein [Mycobacterium avium subsp. hominissuis]MDO2397414.1 hypothetical protein [Mycobacterium avium subsp. hominissuis]